MLWFCFQEFFSLLQGEDNIEYYLGLTPSGIIVLRNRSKVGNYFWPRITKIYFKGKYFMLRVRDKNVSYKQLSEEKNYLSFCWKISRQPCLFLFQNEENTYGFETPSRQSCKHLWKCCVEHDAFFRLLQVSNKSHVPIKSSILCTRKNNNLRLHFKANPSFNGQGVFSINSKSSYLPHQQKQKESAKAMAEVKRQQPQVSSTSYSGFFFAP